MSKEKKAKLTYVKNSKRFHKYEIEDEVMVGTVYLPKDQDIPDRIVFEVKK